MFVLELAVVVLFLVALRTTGWTKLTYRRTTRMLVFWLCATRSAFSSPAVGRPGVLLPRNHLSQRPGQGCIVHLAQRIVSLLGLAGSGSSGPGRSRVSIGRIVRTTHSQFESARANWPDTSHDPYRGNRCLLASPARAASTESGVAPRVDPGTSQHVARILHSLATRTHSGSHGCGIDARQPGILPLAVARFESAQLRSAWLDRNRDRMVLSLVPSGGCDSTNADLSRLDQWAGAGHEHHPLAGHDAPRLGNIGHLDQFPCQAPTAPRMGKLAGVPDTLLRHIHVCGGHLLVAALARSSSACRASSCSRRPAQCHLHNTRHGTPSEYEPLWAPARDYTGT